MTAQKSTGLFGKFGENYVIGIFLENNFEVFRPDFDRGTDVIIKKGKKCYSFQIKTRNYETDEDRHLIIEKQTLKQVNFIIYILYNGHKDINFLVIPSKDLLKWKAGNDIKGLHYPIKYNYDHDKPEVSFSYKERTRNLKKYLNENGLKLIK